jgi:four helix bundle protein
VRDYRNLLVWRKAHSLTIALYRVTKNFPKEELFGLTSQIRRASVSIEANLAEGCGRRSDGEMARFVQIAMGSGAELSCHLLLARDLELIKDADYKDLNEVATEILRMLSTLSERVRRPASREARELTAKG